MTETVFSHSYNTTYGNRIFKSIQHHLRNRIWKPLQHYRIFTFIRRSSRRPYFQIHTTPRTEPYLKPLQHCFWACIFTFIGHSSRRRYFQIHTTPLAETVFSNSYNTPYGDSIFKFIQHLSRRPYFKIHVSQLTENIFSYSYCAPHKDCISTNHSATIAELHCLFGSRDTWTFLAGPVI